MSDYDISIVIVTQSLRKTLKDSLNSVFNATIDHNPQIIIIKQTDDLLDFRVSRRVEIINCNYSTAPEKRNLGLSHAKSKYIHFLDDDDFLNKNFYKIMLKRLAIDTNAIGIACSVAIVNKNKKVLAINNKGNLICKYKNLLLSNKIGTTSSVILKSQYIRNNSFRCGLNARQDFELWLRLLKKHKNMHFDLIPNILLSYSSSNKKSLSMSNSLRDHFKAALTVIFIEKRRFIEYFLLSIGLLRYLLSKKLNRQ